MCGAPSRVCRAIASAQSCSSTDPPAHRGTLARECPEQQTGRRMREQRLVPCVRLSVCRRRACLRARVRGAARASVRDSCMRMPILHEPDAPVERPTLHVLPCSAFVTCGLHRLPFAMRQPCRRPLLAAVSASAAASLPQMIAHQHLPVRDSPRPGRRLGCAARRRYRRPSGRIVGHLRRPMPTLGRRRMLAHCRRRQVGRTTRRTHARWLLHHGARRPIERGRAAGGADHPRRRHFRRRRAGDRGRALPLDRRDVRERRLVGGGRIGLRPERLPSRAVREP